MRRFGRGRVVQGGVVGEVELGGGEAGHLLGDVGAGQRHAGLVVGELQVEDVDGVVAEGALGAGEVELPHADEALVVEGEHRARGWRGSGGATRRVVSA